MIMQYCLVNICTSERFSKYLYLTSYGEIKVLKYI